MMSQRNTRSEFDHCVYFKSLNDISIILVLYVYDILIAGKGMEEIKILKARMARTFYMKDLEATK